MFTLPKLRAGDPVRHEGIAVYPLFADCATVADYLLSDEALAGGSAVVEETSEGGTVPHLIVIVTADRPVLFLEGEELRGAKQNRVLNTSVLATASAKTVIPVSCVEQGRWRYTSRHFGSFGSHASAKMRRVLKESVTRSAYAGRGHGSDQSAVWTEVGRQMNSLGATSPSCAMSDTYESQHAHVSAYQLGLQYVPNACGLAVAVGDRIVSVDVFDSPATCQKVWARLLSGVILDAVEDRATAAPADVQKALAAFAADWKAVPAAGAGEEYRAVAAGGHWHGTVLAKDGRVIHGSLVLAG
jgi:hypothetical protein